MVYKDGWVRNVAQVALSEEDNRLLDELQRDTLKYFTEFAHPVSGMARDRSNGDPDIVVTGSTGFGVMAMIAGVARGEKLGKPEEWITRREACERITKIVGFLKGMQEKSEKSGRRYHGVFPHFLDGATGDVFIHCKHPQTQAQEKDKKQSESGDIVETSFLMMGLLAAREYFHRHRPSAEEKRLCDGITDLWEKVEWDKHARGDQLYWHRHPDSGELMLPVEGWNECLVTQVLAASGKHAVSPEIYRHWIEGKHCNYGGDLTAGPLFFAHFSFLGLDPRGLKDTQGNDFFQQNCDHVRANREHCEAQYGPGCWGLTVCDGDDGYEEFRPANDKGIIAPTAALPSFPYEPEHALAALKYFQTLGIRGKYGFYDGFKIDRETGKALWCSNSYVAIDQGPIVGMIENGRSGLLWDLCMNCPEVRQGLHRLGFVSRNEGKRRAV